MYHVKVMVVDDVWTSVGSTNFDNRSFRLNDEANLNIFDAGFAAGAGAPSSRPTRPEPTGSRWRSGAGAPGASGPSSGSRACCAFSYRSTAIGARPMGFLRLWWIEIWSSLWFIPGLIVVGAVAAAVLLVDLTFPSERRRCSGGPGSSGPGRKDPGRC